MHWAVILKISATVLLLTGGLLTIPRALLGATLTTVLWGTAGAAGVIAAVSAFKLKQMASRDHPEAREDDN